MARDMLPGVEFVENAYACLEGADAAVVITEWDEFRALDLNRVKAALAKPVMIGMRNIYPIKTMKALGFPLCLRRARVQRRRDNGPQPDLRRRPPP